MALLIATPGRDVAVLVDHLQRLEPALDLRVWPDCGRLEDIEFAVLWQQPPGLLAALPALKAVSSLGAGVEHVLADPDLPMDVPVGRLAGPRLGADMAAYLVAQVVSHWRRLAQFSALQANTCWEPWAPESVPLVGLLGTGAMGSAVVRAFQALSIPVAGWNRSGAAQDDIPMHQGADGLMVLAGLADYLICLLPLTPATRGILDADLFARMKPDSVLINVARGAHLDEMALLAALERGRPGLALLDVFQQEPLPPEHPFWQHPRVRITPHCASLTCMREAAELILESYGRVRAGQSPLGLVKRQQGY